MGGEDQARPATAFARDLRERFGGMRGNRLNEAGMVVEGPNLIDRRRAFANHSLRRSNILAVLPAAGVGAIGRSEKAQAHRMPSLFIRPSVSAGQRMPVAVSPIDRQADSMGSQFALQCRDQRTVLVVDGTVAAEFPLVSTTSSRRFAEPLAAQNISRKGAHRRAFPAAEEDSEIRVIIALHLFQMLSLGRRCRLSGGRRFPRSFLSSTIRSWHWRISAPTDCSERKPRKRSLAVN